MQINNIRAVSVASADGVGSTVKMFSRSSTIASVSKQADEIICNFVRSLHSGKMDASGIWTVQVPVQARRVGHCDNAGHARKRQKERGGYDRLRSLHLQVSH